MLFIHNWIKLSDRKLKTYLMTMKQNSEKQKAEETNVFWGQNCVFNGKMTSEGIFRPRGESGGGNLP